MRKLWRKPELIALVKGTSDERVLQGCKGSGAYSAGPDTTWDVSTPCEINGQFCGPCKLTDLVGT